MKDRVSQFWTRMDRWGERLSQKELRIPVDLTVGVVFFLFALAILLVMPQQVAISEKDTVDGRAFPTLLMVVMMLCCAALVVKELYKLATKQPMSWKVINLNTELKALVVLAILVVSYLLSRATDLFVVGAIFCCLGFLVYFRLFLPVTYTMTAIPGMMFLLGIYCAGGYGGSVSAILINTPGTPHAAATMLDGHPLSQQGRTKAALKIALYASTFGGVFSALMLLFLGPQVAKVAAQLGTAEYFMVCVFGLTISACWWASSRAPAPPRPPGSATTRPRTCPSTPRSSDTAPWRAWPPPSRPTTPSPVPPSSPCSPWASPATVPWPSCSPP